MFQPTSNVYYILQKNQAIEDIAKILQQKEAEFCEIEKIESGLRAENAILKKQLEQANAERMKNMAKMSELINLSEKTRDMYSKSKKKSDNLLSAISRAKQLMTVITTVRD